MATDDGLRWAGGRVAETFAELVRDFAAADIPPAIKERLLRRTASVLIANSHAHYAQSEKLVRMANEIHVALTTTTTTEQDDA